MGDALGDALRGADVIWLTTWRQYAPDRVAPLVDLPDWPWLDYPRYDKTAAVITDQLTWTRPFVWIDDELPAPPGFVVPGLEPHRIHQALGDAGRPVPPNLIIVPTARTGLRPSDVERIRVFLQTHTRRSGGVER